MASLYPIPDNIRASIEHLVKFWPEELADLLRASEEDTAYIADEIGDARRVLDEVSITKRHGHDSKTVQDARDWVDFAERIDFISKELAKTARAKRDAAKASRAPVAQAAE